MDAMDAISCVGMAPQGALLSRSFADAAIARALHFSLSDAPEPSAAASTTAALPAVAVLMHGFGAHPPTGDAVPLPSSPARCRLWLASPSAIEARAHHVHQHRRRHVPHHGAAPHWRRRNRPAAEIKQKRNMPAAAAAGQCRRRPQPGPPPAAARHRAIPSGGPAAHAAPAAYTTAPPPAPAEQHPLFPTLDSWKVMYGKNEVV
ncbi:hypothetical protein PVAP13_3NG249215 [Panicum virgatum]|uniref:Uncharacterized protein n=1 Tax=Panicum virgatum TaxID=38727 RepID=A0A8T0U6H2_PANVG|nr:hypothetical protein PVAP13_3NG249215 [Panicum virgatum]